MAKEPRPPLGRAKRGNARRIAAVVSATALAASGLAVAMMQSSQASAATGGVTGYASMNGGTTGGAGGAVVKATTGTEINQALCDRASSSTPIIIEVEGTIDQGNTTAVSGCNTESTEIQFKDASNITLIGVGSGAVFDQIGIHIRAASNIIIQNVTVENVKKSPGTPTSNNGDAIGMESDVHNVWIDHDTLEASGCPACTEAQGYDSLTDMKENVTYVTESYNIYRNIEHVGLIGHNDSDTTSTDITFDHNLYQNLGSRTQLTRGATVHLYDNYWDNLSESGVNSRAGAKVKVEDNYFKNAHDPIGCFYDNDCGSWQVSGNIFDGVTWSTEGDEDHPAGPNPTSTTTVDIPYTYKADPASCVPAIVDATAGANNGLKVSNGDCTATTSPPASTATPTPTATGTSPTSPSCPTNPPSGTNLSLGAGADGSSKASGTSYGNVIDGDMSTYWSPDGTTGTISVKWGSDTTVSSIDIREAAGSEGTIGSYKVVDHDNGAVLATGSGAGVISFSPTSLKKIDFVITSASGTPKVAEFETFAGSSTSPTCSPTTTPPTTPPPTTGPPTSGAVYVASDGTASAAGTESDPTTLASAISKVSAGGTIYLRGGTYDYSAPITIPVGDNGSSSARTTISAYPGETPVLDFSGESETSTSRGIQLFGNYWHLYGLTVEYAGDNGIAVGGSHNVIERTTLAYNRDTGLQISRASSTTAQSDWPSDNLVISSVSHDNKDSTGENADGFAAKLTAGPGNVFQYDVAHNNSDDGWDLYTKSATGPIGPVTIEDSLSYDEGTLSDGSGTPNGDGNGFKLGGDKIAVNNVVLRDVSVGNNHDGFTYNSNPGDMTVTDDVSIDNAERNFHWESGDSVFRNDTSCRFNSNGSSNDKVVGDTDSSDQFWMGSNGSRCSSYQGSLGWSFDSSGHLVVTFGGNAVNP